jgi:hypothetical protein
MKPKICFPPVADPFFTDSCIACENLALPSGFASEGLPEYLPHRHLEIRKRWRETWSAELARRLSGLRIALGTKEVIQRLRDWALARGVPSGSQVGQHFARAAIEARKLTTDPDRLGLHLEEVLVTKWGLARYYRTASYVDQWYAQAMAKLAGKEMSAVLKKLFKSIRLTDRFLEAINQELEVLDCEISLPKNPVPWVLDCSLGRRCEFIVDEFSSISAGYSSDPLELVA